MTRKATPAKIEKREGGAAWRKIADALAFDIGNGQPKPGEKLPSETVLATRYSVNRHTVRQALSALAEQGMVRTEHGRGTTVLAHTLDYALGRKTRFSANLLGQGREPGMELLSATIVPASESLGITLGVAKGVALTRLETLSFADGVPIAYTEGFFPAAPFPGLGEIFAERKSVSSTLAAFGIQDYCRQSTRITARQPTVEEAKHLEQATSIPILFVEAVHTDGAGRRVHVGRSRFSSIRVQLTLETPD